METSTGININFTPSVKQYKAWEYLTDEKTTFVGYGGAAFGGKSYLLCYWITTMALAYPNTAWGLGRKELTTLKRTTLLTLFKVFKESNITEADYNYNQQLNNITFNNGSVIFLIDTAHKPSDPLNTRFGGYELTSCAVDESSETDSKVIDILSTRIGRRNNDKYGLKAKFLETFNPARNHVYNRYYLPYTNKDEKKNYVFIPALPKDNPSPETEEYIRNIIENNNTTTIERLIHGNFEYDDDPSALCDFDSICDIFTNTHVPEGKKTISADLAMQGRDRFIAASWSGLRAIIEVDKPKSTAKEIENDLTELKNRKGVGNSNIVADSDGLGAYLDSYMTGITTFHGGGRAVHPKEFGNIKDECAFKLAEKINNRELYIECTTEQKERITRELATCLKRDNVDLDKKKIIKKEKMKELSSGDSPDYLDGLLMNMRFHLDLGMVYNEQFF